MLVAFKESAKFALEKVFYMDIFLFGIYIVEINFVRQQWQFELFSIWTEYEPPTIHQRANDFFLQWRRQKN